VNDIGAVLQFAPDNSRSWVLHCSVNGEQFDLPIIGFAVTSNGESDSNVEPVVLRGDGPETEYWVRLDLRAGRNRFVNTRVEWGGPERWQAAHDELMRASDELWGQQDAWRQRRPAGRAS
jgi:hypothetical protein